MTFDIKNYHEETKHQYYRYARSLGYLDWDTQPNPFRHYEGAKRISLSFNPSIPRIPYEALYDDALVSPQPVNEQNLADFFRYALGLSAWKQIETARWSLRVNPSSGNLHPTEGYLISGPTAWSEQPALFHYAPDAHALELRAQFSLQGWHDLMKDTPSGSVLVGVSSVHWREAWKYGERAFRYCQHDCGHAIAALRFSAAILGWKLRLLPEWSTKQIAALLGLNRDEFHEDEREEAECIALVSPVQTNALPVVLEETQEFQKTRWYGKPNVLSPEHVRWEIIDQAAEVTRSPGFQSEINSYTNFLQLIAPRQQRAEAHSILLQRRSAVDFDGKSTIDLEDFIRLMAKTLPGPHSPWDALWWPPCIHLAVFVHRVVGLEQGLYLLVRDTAKREDLQQAFRPDFRWEKPDNISQKLPLYLMEARDCRSIAAGISCSQAIAGDSFFSLGMIAEFTPSLETYGPWFYRNLFWEAGVIGQVLYLEAEATGVRSTGIGCYFDDPMHDLLGIKDMQYQSLYHFTVGVPVEDKRLTTLPGYEGEVVCT